MAIVAKTSAKDIESYMKNRIRRIEDVIVRSLQRLGEETIAYARDRSGRESWFDQTGNLRSSIGYVVGKDGKALLTGGFSQVGEGSDGSSEGRQFALELAREMAGKYFLIVVAGMKYASYVEDMENKDVLASPQILAQDKLARMVKNLDTILDSLK